MNYLKLLLCFCFNLQVKQHTVYGNKSLSSCAQHVFIYQPHACTCVHTRTCVHIQSTCINCCSILYVRVDHHRKVGQRQHHEAHKLFIEQRQQLQAAHSHSCDTLFSIRSVCEHYQVTVFGELHYKRIQGSIILFSWYHLLQLPISGLPG